MLKMNKKNKINAYLITLYGEKMYPHLYKMLDKDHTSFKSTKSAAFSDEKKRTMFCNIQKSFSILSQLDALVLNALEQNIIFIEKGIEILEKQMRSISQKVFNQLYKCISFIKGMGNRIALEIILVTVLGKHFQRTKQFSKYITST